MTEIELLAPAGDLERLKMAIIYGADAVYIGGDRFGLRAAAKNFSIEDIMEGVDFAHSRGKKVYVTVNMIPHNEDFEGLDEYLVQLEAAGVDAFIVSDPGVIMSVKSATPKMEIHLSTQANNTNYMSARFWHSQGVKRVVVARELSFEEIRTIRDNTPDDLDIEAFVHGAMCISYSGRCLISNYMTGKDSNRGECKHPCRWNYVLMEEKRPGEYFPVYEDERGTFFFNSKDLCMIENIPQIIESGIKSLKIEGRMKSAYYVATVVRAYRMAIDSYLQNPKGWTFDEEWMNELKTISHRDFTKGFYFEKPGPNEHHYGSSSYIRGYDFMGIVKSYEKEGSLATVEQRNKIEKGDTVEVIGPNFEKREFTVSEMWDEKGMEIDSAPHPKQIVRIRIGFDVEENYMLRKRVD